jgi:hypothetical protein
MPPLDPPALHLLGPQATTGKYSDRPYHTSTTNYTFTYCTEPSASLSITPESSFLTFLVHRQAKYQPFLSLITIEISLQARGPLGHLLHICFRDARASSVLSGFRFCPSQMKKIRDILPSIGWKL